MKLKLRRASIFAKIVIVALLLYAGVTLVQLNQRIGEAKTEQAALQSEVDAYVRENAELSYKIEHSEDEDIIEDIARNELGLVEPGEKIFIDETKRPLGKGSEGICYKRKNQVYKIYHKSSILNTTNYTPIADSYDVEFLDKDNKVTTKASEAVKVRFTFENNAAIDLSKDYIATINFMSNKTDKYFGGVVNTATFSANFSIPAFTDLLQKDMNVFDAEGKVASAYMLDAYAYEASGFATSTYKFQSAFTNLGANVEKGFTFELELDDDNNNIIVDNLTSARVANLASNNYVGTGSKTISVTSKDIANGAAVTLDNTKAYGKELIIKLTSAKYVGVYSYDDISFKIKLLSPIKEGKFEAKGGAVEVAATDVTTVTAEQVWGLTAKSIKYDLFKTAVKQSDGTFKGDDWARQDVASVTFSTDGTKVTIQEPAGATTKGEPTDAIVDSKTGTITTPSSIALRASGNVGDRDKLTIKVKDIWGYELTNQVDVVVK